MSAAHGVAIALGVTLTCGGLFACGAYLARDVGWRLVGECALFTAAVVVVITAATALIMWGFGA